MSEPAPAFSALPRIAPTPAEARRHNGLVGALQNGLAVLDLFGPTKRVVTVGEIAAHLKVHKSSASRTLATLVASGYLAPAPGGGFHLGSKLAMLGQIATGDSNLSTLAKPVVESIVKELGETGHVGVLDGTEAVTLALVDGWHAIRMHSWVGKRSLAHCTAMGKAMLADLSNDEIDALYPDERLPTETDRSVAARSLLKRELALIRRQGYSLDNEELEIGLRCVAAPVFDYTGRVVASLTISGSASRVNPSNLSAIASRVISAADELSSRLGSARTPERWGADAE